MGTSTVVIPNINANQLGPSNQAYPFNQGNMRYQQVFAADQFQGLTGIITEIRYRVDEGFLGPFVSNPMDVEIRLSHTTVVPTNMNLTFADNLGSDVTLVYDGPLTLSSAGQGAFDILVDIDDVFVYNGTQNLLLEVKVFGSAGSRQFDAAGTGIGEGGTPWTDRVWSTAGPNSVVGSSDGDDGMVTQFTLDLPPPTCPVTVAFDFKPNTLNLRSAGRWISAHIEPPAPYSPSDIDVASIVLNGTVPVDPAAPVSIGDGNGNGIPDLKVKFDRAAVQATVVEGDSVPVELRGTIGGECFKGGDVARMIHAPVTSPEGGRLYALGQPTPIRWQTPPGVAARWVAVLTSFDGGENWELVADHLPNYGFHEWQTPYVTVSDARVAVVLVEDELGEEEVEGVLGIGPKFSIGSTTGVGPMGTAFALNGATPHPARGRMRLSISLPDAEPAMIALYDLAGRRAWAKDVGALGPGRHVIEVAGSGTMPAGVYLARLSRPGQMIERRVVLMR